MAWIASEVSAPEFQFTDTVAGVGPTSFQAPRPQRWEVMASRVKTANQSNSGRKETLYWRTQDMIEIGWTLLGPGLSYDGEVGFEQFKILWESCRDGTPFTLIRNVTLGATGYPSTSGYKLHANQWLVRFSDSMDDFIFRESRNMEKRFDLTLKLEEVL